MFWCDCLRVFSCGLFGLPEGSVIEKTPVHPKEHTEVKYTFAIKEESSSDEAISPVISGSSSSCNFLTPTSDDLDSPWEVLENE